MTGQLNGEPPVIYRRSCSRNRVARAFGSLHQFGSRVSEGLACSSSKLRWTSSQKIWKWPETHVRAARAACGTNSPSAHLQDTRDVRRLGKNLNVEPWALDFDIR